MAIAPCFRYGKACPRRYGVRERRLLSHLAVGAVVVVASAGPAIGASANNTRAAKAVVTAQVIESQRENALNTCLVASPTKNTPCIRREALLLAMAGDREIKAISSALDGTEKECVRKVAGQEIAYLKLWKAGGLALYRNERKKAKSFFIKSLKLGDAQKQIEPGCFALVLGNSGP